MIPNTRDEFEFFLMEIRQVNRTGGPRMKMIWVATDMDLEIVEFAAMVAGKPGPRLVDIEHRLGQPLKKGMHIFSRLQQHYTESVNDDLVWEFRYESIKPQPTKQSTIDPAIKKRVLAYALKAKTRDEAATTLKALNPAYLPVLDQLIASGEVVLA